MSTRRAAFVAAVAALILAAALAGALLGALDSQRTVERRQLEPWIETLYGYDCGDRP